MNNKGFVVSAVLYPLLVLFLSLIMGLISMNSTRKNILDNMKMEISDSIFDSVTCDCEEINLTLKRYNQKFSTVDDEIDFLKTEINNLKSVSATHATTTTVSLLDAKLEALILSVSKPIVFISSGEESANKITIPLKISSPLGYDSLTCKYSNTSGSYTQSASVNANNCIISNITANKTYYYQICITNDGYSDCSTGKVSTGSFNTHVAVGDYVQMTPAASSVTLSTTETGYSSSQTLNPQELNLWRVLKINTDGTILMISEYASSKALYFKGLTGWQNSIGTLRKVADSYKNTNYTISTDYPRAGTQVDFWESTYVGQSEYNKADYSETSLILDVLGSWLAKKKDGTAVPYWLAHREVQKSTNDYSGTADDSVWQSPILYEIDSSGSSSNKDFYQSICYYIIYNCLPTSSNAVNSTYTVSSHVRPMVTLRATIADAKGEGTSANPWILD